MSGFTITVSLSPETLLSIDGLSMALDRIADAVSKAVAEYQRGGGAPKVARDDAEPRKATQPDGIDAAGNPSTNNVAPEAHRPPVSRDQSYQAPPPAPSGAAVAAPARAAAAIEPEVPTPAVAPREVAASTTHWATEERKAALRRMYPSDVDGKEIMAALERMPGGPLPKWNTVQVYVIEALRVCRSPERRAQFAGRFTKRAAAPAPTVEPAPAPVAALPPVTVRQTAPLPPHIDKDAARIRRQSNAFALAMTLPPAQPADTTTPIVTDFGTIRAKAATWGVRFDARDDLGAVNAHAARIGHRPFQIETPQQRAAGRTSDFARTA